MTSFMYMIIHAEDLNHFTSVQYVMNRRSLLTVGGAGLLSSFAGCLSLSGEPNVDPEKINFIKKKAGMWR